MIFHWPLSELLAMDLTDLFAWRNRAVDRWNIMNGTEKRDGR
jgi:hypothetical protein